MQRVNKRVSFWDERRKHREGLVMKRRILHNFQNIVSSLHRHRPPSWEHPVLRLSIVLTCVFANSMSAALDAHVKTRPHVNTRLKKLSLRSKDALVTRHPCRLKCLTSTSRKDNNSKQLNFKSETEPTRMNAMKTDISFCASLCQIAYV